MSTIQAKPDDDGAVPKIPLATGEHHRIVLPAPKASRVRMFGMLFDANKCFLLPHALPGIKTVVAQHQQDPSAEVLIVGHAGGDEDLAGMDIAADRAAILAAYLKSKPAVWLAWFGADKNARSRWGTREIQLMLSVLPEGKPPFYAGFASGITDKATRAAIKAYQIEWNRDRSRKDPPLPTNGTADARTRRALVEDYMGLEDTTLAKGILPVVHGCEGHIDDTPAESGEEADDRKLEVFFWKGGILPTPTSTTSGEDDPLYPAWLKRVTETKDFECHGIHVQIVDAKKLPAPFATVHLGGPTSGEATTDEHGFVSFFGLKPGTYTIRSEKNGYQIGVSKLQYPTAKTLPGYAKPRAA